MVPIVPAAGFDEAAILRLAASVERSSEHPLADATVRAAGEWNLKLADAEEFDSPTGKGVIGTVDGKAALLGNAQFIVSSGIRTQSLEEQAEELRMPPANRRLRKFVSSSRCVASLVSSQEGDGTGAANPHRHRRRPRGHKKRFRPARPRLRKITIPTLCSCDGLLANLAYIAAGAQRAWPLVELL